MKKSILWFLCLNLVLILDAQEARTENNGNLILEDIPIIPQSIKDDLSIDACNNTNISMVLTGMRHFYH